MKLKTTLVLSFALLALPQIATAQKKPEAAKQPAPVLNPPAPKDAAAVPTPPAEPAVPAPPPEVVSPGAPTPGQEMPAAPVNPHLFGLHAAVGLPHPLSVGFNYVHPSKIFSVEANAGSFGLTQDGVDAKMSNMELGLRWHPFMGAFYLGANLGQRTISAQKTEDVSGTSVTGKAEVKSSYLAPHVGWMWGMGGSGFFVSMDIGVVSPSGVTTSFTSDVPAILQNDPDYIKLEKEVNDEGDKLGNTTLPMLTLLKIGYLF